MKYAAVGASACPASASAPSTAAAPTRCSNVALTFPHSNVTRASSASIAMAISWGMAASRS